jgi:hypothetical protein
MDKPKAEIKLTVDGMEFSIDILDLTGREVGTLKRIGHLRGINDLVPALENADTEAIAVLAGIAMERSGNKTVNYDYLLDLPLGKIKAEVLEPESSGNPLGESDENDNPETTGNPS